MGEKKSSFALQPRTRVPLLKYFAHAVNIMPELLRRKHLVRQKDTGDKTEIATSRIGQGVLCAGALGVWQPGQEDGMARRQRESMQRKQAHCGPGVKLSLPCLVGNKGCRTRNLAYLRPLVLPWPIKHGTPPVQGQRHRIPLTDPTSMYHGVSLFGGPSMPMECMPCME